MRLQLLSDLHLETEDWSPTPAPDAEVLVLAGDVDASWRQLEAFGGWPVPVLMVAGNHEFDRRELGEAWPALRARCASVGIRLLERESYVMTDAAGRRIRFLGTVRWSDFDLFGASQRPRALRAARYFVDVMRSTLHGQLFDATAVRQESLACRAWLETALRQRHEDGPVDATVVVTHYAPSLRCADPRYGAQPGTASFCNADDDLFPLVDLWLHGHLHCRHDLRLASGGHVTRVISNARGHARKGEADGHDGFYTVDV